MEKLGISLALCFLLILQIIFSNENYLKKFSSGIIFKLLNNSNTIKKYLMKEASGLSGDIPKLLKGENI